MDILVIFNIPSKYGVGRREVATLARLHLTVNMGRREVGTLGRLHLLQTHFICCDPEVVAASEVIRNIGSVFTRPSSPICNVHQSSKS